MAMAKFTIKYDDKDVTLQTDDFNEEQKGIFAEAQAAETELQRAKYMVAVFNDRRDFLLSNLVKSVEASKDKEKDDKEET